MFLPESSALFVADIGGSFIKFGFSQNQASLTELERVPTPAHEWHDFVAALSYLLQKYSYLLQKHDAPSQKTPQKTPLALSIAAMFDPLDGKAFSANIPCLSGHIFENQLSSELGRPVIAANDADCSGLAEAMEGAGKGHSNVFCAIFGTGVGGAMIVGGKLVQGGGGVVGEWGHGAISQSQINLDGEGEVTIPMVRCGCGNQRCIDTIGSARGLERIHRHLNHQQCDSHTILQLWQQGEHAAARTISAWLQLVAPALATVINIIGATIVPTGGGLGSVAPLMAALDGQVRARTLHRHQHNLIVPGHFSEDGGLRGAAILARQHMGGNH